ncbi:hypothetical protein K431DRAFT_299128 [Polychaeton citri CBS 116435]|uniref:Uncharacterized protein n=1 Tax=Polychaeton citri CBS 116435 TaxID=1314669 RepID=A0A9P4Q0J6_9PEZI|nr:hypothetical protein K431DRAFT_299128 [Polychaeton citri CBS 116435]
MGLNKWCTCNDGLTRQSATVLGNTEPCPSYAPVVNPTSTSSYTYTSNLYVMECQYSKSDGSYTTNGVTSPYFTCLGSTKTLSYPPTMSVMMSTGSGVLVGGLTGTALHTSVSNALVSACTGTTWPVTGCSSSVAVATDISYVTSENPDGETNESTGTLSLTFGDGIKIESADLLDKLANATGAAAAQYIAGQDSTACKNMKILRENMGRGGGAYIPAGDLDVCSVPQSIILQWNNGTLVAPGFVNDEVWVSFEFADDQSHKSVNWLDVVEDVCEAAMGAEDFLVFLAGIFCPEALPVIADIAEIVNTVCEATISNEDD